MRNLILFLIFPGFFTGVSAQGDYLLLTKVRKIIVNAGTDAGIPVNITYESVEYFNPKFRPIGRKIREGTMIRVRSYDLTNDRIKGRLDIVNDSLINVGTNTILIEDIRKISARTTFTSISGPIVSGAGIAGTFYMVPLFIDALALLTGEGFIVIAGIILLPVATAALVGCAGAAVGGIIYFITGFVYKTRYNWFNDSGGWHIQVSHDLSDSQRL